MLIVHKNNIDSVILLHLIRPLVNSGLPLEEQKYQFKLLINSVHQQIDDETLSPQSVPIIDSNPSLINRNVVKYNLSYTDLYNTLRESLLVEVPKTNTFNESHISVIKQYFTTILKYFPFRNENVRRLFKRMNIWLAKKGKKPIKTIRYREAMKISDGFLKPKESWRHCNGSKPHLRGYPCGLWILFHTMTVNEYNIFLKGGVMKHDVMFTMRNYIKTFFSCEECVDYFVQATNNMENELIYSNSSVMLLWRLHNQVNHRLQAAPLEDPFFPKTQFPRSKLCVRCVRDNNQYNTTEVFSFLLSYYDKKTIMQNCSAQVNTLYGFFIIISIISNVFHSVYDMIIF